MGKPRIQKLIDDYALQSGDHWMCHHAGICARGKTPEEAYKKLMDHFDFLVRIRTANTVLRRARA